MFPRKPLLALLALALAAAPLQAQEKTTIKASKDQLDFLVGGTLATRYITDSKYAKPFFFPVLSPNGASLTRALGQSPRTFRANRRTMCIKSHSGFAMAMSFRKE